MIYVPQIKILPKVSTQLNNKKLLIVLINGRDVFSNTDQKIIIFWRLFQENASEKNGQNTKYWELGNVVF